ncbi:DUF732 domain-containing protein [Mycolicibacterium sediminis]|uniref:DUF732 domain-containing protein n=1 Tax=Mycolicibacterium sediminis TaxID=1286180 RepID=A0A7I7QT91_9MYCO|nr:DUF732 domain-containing protein [Mycolicibacterium sediminis]BBY29524.1 hypothetical protein MSEDJ_36200 [Mycolicibacterium sediminis]
MRGKFVVSVAAVGFALATTFAPPALADENDEIFLSVLDDEGITYPSAVDAVKVGMAVCDYLQEGNSLLDATQEVSNETSLNIEDSGFFVGAAAATYCPSESP